MGHEAGFVSHGRRAVAHHVRAWQTHAAAIIAGAVGGGADGCEALLAATLAVVPSVPVAGMALILGIDRFMSECRAITNFIGNAVATVVVARWEGALDEAALAKAIRPKDFPMPGARPD